MKITKQQLRKIIKEELLKEALPPHLQKHFRKDGSSVYEPQITDVTPAGYGPDDDYAGGDPAKQEYDALTTMISRLNGMEAFLLNTTRQKSDEALTQQAAEQLNALHATLSQLRKGIK